MINNSALVYALLGASVLLTSTTAIAASNVAYVANLEGKVLVQKADGSQVRAKHNMGLRQGDRLLVLKKSSATISSANGCQSYCAADSRVKIDENAKCGTTITTITKGPTRVLKRTVTRTRPIVRAAQAPSKLVGMGGTGVSGVGSGLAGVGSVSGR